MILFLACTSFGNLWSYSKWFRRPLQRPLNLINDCGLIHQMDGWAVIIKLLGCCTAIMTTPGKITSWILIRICCLRAEEAYVRFSGAVGKYFVVIKKSLAKFVGCQQTNSYKLTDVWICPRYTYRHGGMYVCMPVCMYGCVRSSPFKSI